MKQTLLLLCLASMSLKLFAQKPIITNFYPLSGKPGTIVTITGSNFNSNSANNIVFMGATKATVTMASSNALTVTVPIGATYGPIRVTNMSNFLNGISANNFIPTFSPSKGAPVMVTDFLLHQDFNTPAQHKNIFIQDIDGDGKGDLVSTNSVFSNTISIYRNISTNGTVAFDNGVQFLGGNYMNDIAIGDLDNDGKPDIITACEDNKITFIRNLSTPGTISFSSTGEFAAYYHHKTIVLSDLDLDGKPEVIVPDQNGNINIHQNTSTPGNISANTLLLQNWLPTPTQTVAVTAGDLNGDGKPELVSVSDDFSLAIFKNNAGPGVPFTSTMIPDTSFSISMKPIQVTLGDLDGDEKMDIIITSNSNSNLAIFRNNSNGNGKSTFDPEFTLTGFADTKPVLSDLNGDGKLEILVPHPYNNKLIILSNQSEPGVLDATSFSRIEIPTAVSPVVTAAGDLDGDHKPELITGNSAWLQYSFSVMKNNMVPVASPRNALHFDGINDMVELPFSLASAATASSNNAITIEYWFKGSSLQSAVRFQDGNYIVVGWNNKHIISSDGGHNGVAIDPNVLDGQWHHIAMTWQRNTMNGFKSYVDGKLFDQRNSADVALPTILTNAYLGSYNGNSEFMHGSLDEVRIYNTALSHADIQADMKSSAIAAPGNLLAYFNFDEGVAGYNNTGITQLTDQSSNAFHGSLNNFVLQSNTSNWIESYAMVVPTIAAASSVLQTSFIANWLAPISGHVDFYYLDVATDSSFTSFLPGYQNVVVNGTSQLITGLTQNTTYYYRVRANKSSVNLQGCYSDFESVITTTPYTAPGNALHFDGINDHIPLPASLISAIGNSSGLTIAFYFKGSEFQNAVRLEVQNIAQVIIAGLGNQGNYSHLIGLLNSNLIAAGNNIIDGNWHHIAITFQPGQTNGFKSYLDGQLIAQINAASFMPNLPSSGGYLGSRYGTTDFMEGSIDELRFYNRVLTQAEIQADMIHTTSIAPGNMLAYYNFDHGIANANNSGINYLLDNSGNGHHATIQNFALNGSTSNWEESYALVQPIALPATAIVGSGFTATWNPSAIGQVSTYILDIAKDINFTQPISGSPFSVTGTNYVVSGFQLDTFFYRVRAQKNGLNGWSVSSNTISVIAGTPPPLLAISGGDLMACDNNAIPSLMATSASGTVIDWYNAASGGSPLLSNSNTFYTGQTNSGVYTYYAEARDLITGLVSTSRTPVSLTIKNTHFNINEIHCENYTWNNVTYTSSGSYTTTAMSSSGCDSIQTLNLTIDPMSTPVVNGSNEICSGSSITLNTTAISSHQYCWKNTSNSMSWHTVGSVLSSGSTTNHDLAMLNGIPYVAYIDNALGKRVVVQKYNGNSWEMIGGSPIAPLTAQNLKLALEGNTPYVAFTDSASGFKLSVKKFDGSNWVYVGTPTFTSGGATYPNLLFSSGIPYVSFCDASNSNKITVMRLIHNNWEYVGLPGFSSSSFTSYLSMAFDGGTPYVAFTETGPFFKATVMKYNGSTWVNVGSNAFTPSAGTFLSLAIDNGTPYISFRDASVGSKVSVMKYNGSNWVFVGPQGFSAGNSPYTSITFSNHIPYVSYNDNSSGSKATVVKFNGSSWTTVGTTSFSGGSALYLRLGVYQDVPYVVYADGSIGSKALVQNFDFPCENNTANFTLNTAANLQVQVTNASGCQASSAPMNITVTPCDAFQVKLFIQGYYLGGNQMQPVLYNQGVSGSTTETELITVELHAATAPYSVIATSSCLLQTNGTATANFSTSYSGSYYVVVRTRNGLTTWSANPITIPSSSTYDFSIANAQAFGNNQVEVATGVWALYSGDINQDFTVDVFDYLLMEPDIVTGVFGFVNTDSNGDGVVDLFDYLIIEPNITNGIGVLEP